VCVLIVKDGQDRDYGTYQPAASVVPGSGGGPACTEPSLPLLKGSSRHVLGDGGQGGYSLPVGEEVGVRGEAVGDQIHTPLQNLEQVKIFVGDLIS